MKTNHPLLFVPACLSAVLLWSTPASTGTVLALEIPEPVAPQTAIDLLGRRIDEIGRFVVPQQIRGPGEGGQYWAFGDDAKLIGFQSLDGLIVEVNPDFDLEANRRADPLEPGPYLGQSLGDLLESRGQAERLAHHPFRSPMDGKLTEPRPYLVYDGKWVFLTDGIVTEITKPLPKPKVYGPGR